jgi:hypothetical protein
LREGGADVIEVRVQALVHLAEVLAEPPQDQGSHAALVSWTKRFEPNGCRQGRPPP